MKAPDSFSEVLRRRRGLVSLVVFLFVWCAAETAALNDTPATENLSSKYRPHPRRFWALRPGEFHARSSDSVIHINSLGLRGPEPPSAAAPLRVLLLGDSCVYCEGIDDEHTIARLLEARLRRMTGGAVDVINGGCPGYSSYQGLDLMHDIGWALHPDVVVICYGNLRSDIMEDRERAGGWYAGQVRTLLWKSPAYRWLKHHLSPHESDLYQPSFGKPPGNLPASVPRVRPADHRENLRSLIALARRQGTRHIVCLVLPKERYQPGPDEHNCDRVLLDVGAQEGLAMDGPALWEDRDRKDCFLDGIHFSVKGAERLADDLAAFFREKGLVKTPSETSQPPASFGLPTVEAVRSSSP